MMLESTVVFSEILMTLIARLSRTHTASNTTIIFSASILIKIPNPLARLTSANVIETFPTLYLQIILRIFWPQPRRSS
jgi:hypothetical protein